MKSKIINIKGIAPLMMENDVCVDPFHPLSVKIREITSKGTKDRTEEDEKKLRWLQWQAHLYWSEQIKGAYIPVDALEACIKAGAQLFRKGREIKRALMVDSDNGMEIPLVYQPKHESKERMFNDPGFVDVRPGKIKGNAILLTRPIFSNWELKNVKIVYDEKRLKDEEFFQALQNAGKYCGLLGYRPRFGRFQLV